jgi:hypothetical protein
MGGRRARAVRTVLALLAAAVLAACGSSDPGPVQAGPGDGVHSSQHNGKHHHKHKHHGKKKHHHKHGTKHHHSTGSSGGNGGNGGGDSGGGSNGGAGGQHGGGGNGGGGHHGGGGHGGGWHHGGGGSPSSSAPPPPSGTSISVTPNSGLKNGQFVNVVGSHFTAGERLVMIECVDHGEATQPSDCQVQGARFVRADGSGTVERSFRVVAKIGKQTCGSPTPCLLTVSPPDQSNHADEADEQIFFG